MIKKIKKTVRGVLGDKAILRIKNARFLCLNWKTALFGKNILSVTDNTAVKGYKTYALDNKHVFCAYYDLDPLFDDKLLVHVCDERADTSLHPCSIGYFDINNGKYCNIASTRAWCWQQGSRLRWSAKHKNTIYFNDLRNGKYVCVRKNIVSGEENEIVSALYDIDREEKYGISVNFGRLQKMRPGYGYDSLKSGRLIKDSAPSDDGLFLVDLEKDTSELVISLKDLARDTDANAEYNHYINHVSFSPDGKKASFFHIWAKDAKSKWFTNLCVLDIKKKKYSVIERDAKVSHYAWRNNQELLMTIICSNNDERYAIYNVEKEEKDIIENGGLRRDGHPVFYDTNHFYSDTYPDSNCRQTIFSFNLATQEYKELVKLYSSFKLIGEQRCDLHPKYLKEMNGIAVDSTYMNNKRSVVVFEIGD